MDCDIRQQVNYQNSENVPNLESKVRQIYGKIWPENYIPQCLANNLI